uniref:RNA-directed DNA polymerase from mobile element jockey-like n=1 Tax=Saccoglossus kowalevskii TaxID=10224 RepID=A0ABM0M5S3_SACKO|nr:PREDICTED: RNA-directed DNA polymerase from mobile element jockey-like [Saccoglossus kowalevskii]
MESTCLHALSISKKAFDSIWHVGLLHKLRNNRVTGKVYNIIKAIYTNSTGCVKVKNGLTNTFPIEKGIRQGDGLSPLLFNIYLNDIKSHINASHNDLPTLLNNQLPCLLYADDLLLLSETNTGLQNAINSLQLYCHKWKLEININKSKTIIFNKAGRRLDKYNFFINQDVLERVTSYTYLGKNLNTTGKLEKAQVDLKNKALKACFKMNQLLFSATCTMLRIHLKMFDAVVRPILLYCTEIWSSDIIAHTKQLWNLTTPMEKLHTKFCKFLLKVNSRASNLPCLIELGRYPLTIQGTKQLLKYWMRVQEMPENTLVCEAYKLGIKMHDSGTKNWISGVKKILENLNLSNIWKDGQIKYNNATIENITEKT